MFWEIGYTICTVLTIIVAVYVMRDQRSRGRGAIAGFAAGLVAGGITMVVLLAALVILATPDSRIEKVKPARAGYSYLTHHNLKARIHV